ncbi:uncharacterized protein PV09_02847 [Verruconis gallopava]|uniref:ubiquitinyl hydrolase 1 n=1 Tax=Verruconis gallopava TaxID=253628 RepID=A0A0D2B591_9PEZI|nr:uncharacterized protein PV09_02847 [Verruconis gallopava]KIW06394.1 hypothetical protein PV09_02847 [Verruconis gallopava]
MELLESVFNHLVLPPQLPGVGDDDPESVSSDILTRVSNVCRLFQDFSSSNRWQGEWAAVWASIAETLHTAQGIHSDGIDGNIILRSWKLFKPNSFFILRIAKQNAALLLYRKTFDGKDEVIFEVFQSSPPAENVLAAEGALLWSFPDRAAKISWAKFCERSFQENLSFFIEQASQEQLQRFAARTQKAGASVIEIRDSTHPGLFFELLLPLLAAIGEVEVVPAVVKRIKDEVNFQNSKTPWRRNPTWLVLRVAIQRQLCLTLGNECGRICFKLFICAVLSKLLEDCVGQLIPEKTLRLRAKLCRRLAKVEIERASLSESNSNVCGQLMTSIGSFCKKIIVRSTEQVNEAWNCYRQNIVRRIPRIMKRTDEHSLVLSLPRSGSYLHGLLQMPHQTRQNFLSQHLPHLDDNAIRSVREVTKYYYKFAALDGDTELKTVPATAASTYFEKRCVELADAMDQFFRTTLKLSMSKPEQMSSFILNVFEMWVAMDKCATRRCPLLIDYHPLFTPEILDVLLLPTAKELQRLQEVQKYIRDRCAGCLLPSQTITSEPNKDAFTMRYCEISQEGQKIRDLQNQIQNDSLQSRSLKESEWRTMCKQYDELSQKISSGTCTCSWNRDGTRDVRGCSKCYYWRCRNRMHIGVHEDFLPVEKPYKAAVAFELTIPPYLQAYRNATWRILRDLAHPSRPSTELKANTLMSDYSQLKRYSRSTACGITLASKTKSFLSTHYKGFKMKIALKDVLLPLGLSFSYYDQKSDLWVKDLHMPLTFAHHCGVHIPRCLSSSVVEIKEHPPAYPSGPTSYECVANQTKCPPNATTNEFNSLQRLISGDNRRWFTMLVELGSSNLNFSDEDTTQLFGHLAIQAGPTRESKEMLRDIHAVFLDKSFCVRLAEQIERRLRVIKSNWRETNQMELLITLSLRLYELAEGAGRKSALRLIETARLVTLDWIQRLQEEKSKATDDKIARSVASYGFLAALQCRRTFIVFNNGENIMQASELVGFVQASIALQQNLHVNPSKLPSVQASMLIRDAKIVHGLHSVIRNSILASKGSLDIAINKSWSETADSSGSQFLSWQFLSEPNETWIGSVIRSNFNWLQKQYVHYNILEGYLLVNGEPLGRLPNEILDSEEVKGLFAQNHLLTFPSSLTGMSHMLACRLFQHQIHFGRRGDRVIIRTLRNGVVHEFVPDWIFREGSEYDLPASLLDNCTHWLNLQNGELEIRRRPYVWKTRPSDWILQVFTHQARRRESLLVDPYSQVYRDIKKIFQGFEEPQHLTVFQPSKGRLSVELKRLALSFYVNNNNLLECRELDAEIDENQDAGTLYGLNSILVLRSLANKENRSVLTPLGSLVIRRNGMHVSVDVNGTGSYAKFEIDNILGRLTCPPEPRLLYTKALLHAATSFPLPDPLTGSTGTEEAYHLLQSGCCQPWTPISKSGKTILDEIAALSPVRDFYPKGGKTLQTVRWNPNLTITIQHECLRQAVEDIISKSNQLHAFSDEAQAAQENDDRGFGHLYRRGLASRIAHERAISDVSKQAHARDDMFKPLNRSNPLEQEKKVYHITKLLHRQTFAAHISMKLPKILQAFPGKFIGGFHEIKEHLGSLSTWIDNDFGEQWGDLVNFCRSVSSDNVYKVLFRLCLLAFNQTATMDSIMILYAFWALNEIKQLEPPKRKVFSAFRIDSNPTAEHLKKFIVPDGPVSKLRMSHSHGKPSWSSKQDETDRLAKFLAEQWPCEQPNVLAFESELLDMEEIMERILPEWTRLYANWELSTYAKHVQRILETQFTHPVVPNLEFWPSMVDFSGEITAHGAVIPSLTYKLLSKSALRQPEYASLDADFTLGTRIIMKNVEGEIAMPEQIAELDTILSFFVSSTKPQWRQYGEDLYASLEALRRSNTKSQHDLSLPDQESIKKKMENTRKTIQDCFSRICDALSSNDKAFPWLRLGQLWPRITPTLLLEQLRFRTHTNFGRGMKESLVSYGLWLTRLQWLRRVDYELKKGDNRKALEEWRNRGHANWDPLEFPDWLLFEIDSNLHIRSEQIDVAKAIISPDSQANSVLQLNMGKGKTSCIVPIVLSVLADAKQLSRLIVPKALLFQTAQILQAKLGGLVGREITHVPFSRRTQTNLNVLKLYSDLHYRTLHNSGVMLTIPEHVLSFKLSGFQHLVDGKLEEAREMIEFQSWLERHSRDVLDESDFSLSVKTQLIYPSGDLMPVDGNPDRWIVAQTLLGLVRDHLQEVRRQFPHGIDVFERSSGFPTIYILHSAVEDSFQKMIVNTICEGRTSIIQLPDALSPAQQEELRQFLSIQDVDQVVLERVLAMLSGNPVTVKNILVIRGYLVNRVLFMCLKKRWNVQYGLHPKRHPIAVPYEAKGIPSEQSEFGHPEVAILLTCLAFYNSGLSLSQLKESLGYILKSDDPAFEYDRWTIDSASLPEPLRHWNVINVDDHGQMEELWQHVRFNTTVINHYMNVFVFPLHAKQFSVKLQLSAWDLPLKSAENEHLCAKTTGFSGTNDNRRLLPLNIEQDDLPSLHQTNAEVLTYLLQKRNRRYILAADNRGRFNEEKLLEKLNELKIRILIDAGAYILEMDNQSVAKMWLTKDPQASAAVYFGSGDNRAWVQYRGMKAPIPLIATPFADNLEGCVVYLDEAHTRGTDLKFPNRACGAVTLALGQTKDHTVQAAMRLRQLATTQSIVFFAPPEVHQSILDTRPETADHPVDSSDIVRWLLEQSCKSNEQLHVLYGAQGSDYCVRLNAAWENPEFLVNVRQRSKFICAIKSPERLTLEELYGFNRKCSHRNLERLAHPGLRDMVSKLIKQRNSSDSNGWTSSSLVMEEVEQEREVEFQVEEIRKIQKPAHRKALKFPGLHEGISYFVDTGILKEGDFHQNASFFLSQTPLGKKYSLCMKAHRLFLSAEFMRTVKSRSVEANDNFYRSIEFVLWSPSTQTALVIIPEEAEMIIPILQASRSTSVHLIIYSAPTTRKMLQFWDLDYYVLPRLPEGEIFPEWLSIELGILGARLYFPIEEYDSLREYFCTAVSSGVGESSETHTCAMSSSLLSFVFDWITLRRNGQDITMTPMAYLCQGKPLHRHHPFFNVKDDVEGAMPTAHLGKATSLTDEIESLQSDSEAE